MGSYAWPLQIYGPRKAEQPLTALQRGESGILGSGGDVLYALSQVE